MELAVTEIRNILTRTTGFLKTVTSHSVQPYRGCSFGNALCGVGCYVQHNPYATQGPSVGLISRSPKERRRFVPAACRPRAAVGKEVPGEVRRFSFELD